MAADAWIVVCRDGKHTLHLDRESAVRQAIARHGVVEGLVRESTISALLMESFRDGIEAERERQRMKAALPRAPSTDANED